MARSLCGVPGLTNGGSAHSRAGSETTDVQRSKQVTVASYTTPSEYYNGVYSMPYIRQWDEHWKHVVTHLNFKLRCGLVHGVKLGLKKTKRVWD